jgi:hypothetical protein
MNTRLRLKSPRVVASTFDRMPGGPRSPVANRLPQPEYWAAPLYDALCGLDGHWNVDLSPSFTLKRLSPGCLLFLRQLVQVIRPGGRLERVGSKDYAKIDCGTQILS